MGHQERLPPLWLNVRCVIRQGTFAGTNGNARDAPKGAIRRTATKPRASTSRQIPVNTADRQVGQEAVIRARLMGVGKPTGNRPSRKQPEQAGGDEMSEAWVAGHELVTARGRASHNAPPLSEMRHDFLGKQPHRLLH